MAETSAEYSGGPEASKSPEKGLLDVLDRMRTNTSGTYVVHLHLSELRASHRQPHFMRMVERSLESLASQQDVQVLNMSNADVVLLCRNTPVDEVDDAVFRVRALFNEDPLTQAEDGSAEDRFSAWFDLSQASDFKDFEDTVRAIAQASMEGKNKQGEALSSGRPSKTMEGEPLTPEMLAGITQKLLEARIGDLVHRQPAVMVGGGIKHRLWRFVNTMCLWRNCRNVLRPR